MKTQLESNNGPSLRSQLVKISVGSLLGLTCCVGANAATVLSGLVIMGTDSSGNWNGTTRWNTQGGIMVAFYVADGADPLSPFLNGPSASQSSISVPLDYGTHTFSLFAPGGSPNSIHGLNLFFDGNNINPGISVFAPTQISSSPPYPVFSVNNATSSQSLGGQTVAAARSLTFMDASSVVTLTDFRWAAPNVYNLDRTGFVPFGQSSVGSDGLSDWVGQFTLSVTPVPEPGTWAILSLCGIGLVVRQVGRRR
jgi:hypothetical protein